QVATRHLVSLPILLVWIVQTPWRTRTSWLCSVRDDPHAQPRMAFQFRRAFSPSRLTSVHTLSRCLCLAIILLAGAASSVAALTVTTTADNVAAPPAGSLRKALADARDGATIDFDAGLSGTITLAGADLLIDKNLTINGPGAAVLAISANQQSRVFRIPPGKVVTISGLAIRDGKAAD